MIYKVEPWVKDFIVDQVEKHYFTNVMLRIKLPLPPTDNQRLILSRGRLVSSPKYRKWVKEAEAAWNYEVKKIKQEKGIDIPLIEPTYEKQAKFEIAITLPDKKTDFSNYVKAIKDFFTGKLYKDDKWVNMSVLDPVKVDRLEAGFEIFIWIEKQEKPGKTLDLFNYGDID